ncbi:glutamine synthetase type I [Cutibacterium acnes JCM 18918]|nr:glutamine synthetase type I [Cutibacterium acnes JCM 18918]
MTVEQLIRTTVKHITSHVDGGKMFEGPDDLLAYVKKEASR